MSDCTVYIDEAGDLGIKRGTRWFVLAAAVVDKKDEPQIRERLSRLKAQINVNNIHLRKIVDFYKRAAITREISEEKFTYICIITDTSKLDTTKLNSSEKIYNYLSRILLERVSWLLRDTQRVGDVVFSARSTKRDGELITYIEEKLLPYPDNSIVKNAINKITVKTAGSWDLLQLADICATTMFSAYEVNHWGFRTPCFSMALKQHLYNHNGETLKYGIKYLTDEMAPSSDELKSTLLCNKKERTPGATTT